MDTAVSSISSITSLAKTGLMGELMGSKDLFVMDVIVFQHYA